MKNDQKLLRKGLEEEVYTGFSDGTVAGLSHRVSADLSGFMTEPDSRNVEFTTAPYREYRMLLDRLMAKRCGLRRYLRTIGDYTLIPGSTLSLDPRDEFMISNPHNPYYQFIRDTYGTDVVTASTHINIGIENYEELIRAYRVVRCDAALYLAMTANSPFLDAEATGYHSTRWHLFPETPDVVPFFRNHDEFVAWFEQQLELKTMNNSRHLWLSVRPNGSDTPYDLNRLELRICDRISEPALVTAVVAMLEAQVWQILEDKALDPLIGFEDYESRNQELIELATRNESAVAKDSLDAEVTDWQTGQRLTASELIERRHDEYLPIATAHGFGEQLERIPRLLQEGNLAQRWLAQHGEGLSAREVIRAATAHLSELDNAYDPQCPQVDF